MAKKVDDKQNVATPAKEKKAVAKNEPKKVPAKKLPKIYKKQYTQKAFEKKLLKHLYIETDKDLVKQLFETSTDKKGRTVMVVPKDKEIAKKDFARYQVLAKQIAEQKGGIKIVPLLAVIILIASIFSFSTQSALKLRQLRRVNNAFVTSFINSSSNCLYFNM